LLDVIKAFGVLLFRRFGERSCSGFEPYFFCRNVLKVGNFKDVGSIKGMNDDAVSFKFR